MFREMRRKKQLLPEEETIAIMNRATCAVIGVVGDAGYPYTFPISHVYDEESNKMYFHSAVSGHKIDAIRNNSKASFCIVGQDKVVPAEYTTRFRSVAGFGKAYIVEEEAERLRAFRLLAEKFCMSALGRFDSVIKDEAPHAEIVALEIEHMTGKEAIELNRMR